MFSWSYSAYSKALECLACYHKRYILKEEETGPTSADLVFGSAMHSAWNAVLLGQDGHALFDFYWDTYSDTPMQFTRYKYDELRHLGHTLLRKFIKSHKERFGIDKSEVRLYGEYKGTKLEGQFDYYGTLDGKLCLLDLKTSAMNYPAEKKDVALQLNLYTYLVETNGYQRPDKIGYVVFNKGMGSIQEPLVWDYDSKTCKEMLDDMTTYCKMFEGMKEYPRNPNCRYHNYNCYKPKESL